MRTLNFWEVRFGSNYYIHWSDRDYPYLGQACRITTDHYTGPVGSGAQLLAIEENRAYTSKGVFLLGPHRINPAYDSFRDSIELQVLKLNGKVRPNLTRYPTLGFIGSSVPRFRPPTI